MGLLSFMSHEYIQSGTSMSNIEKHWIASVKNDGKRLPKKPIERPIKCPSEYTSWYSRATEQKLKNAERQKDFLFERYSGLALTGLIRFNNGTDIPESLETALSTYYSAYQSKIDEILKLQELIREEFVNAESTNS